MPADEHNPPRKAPSEDRPPSREDRIGALIQSPASVYVYWNVQGLRSREVIRELGSECDWVLRVLDLSEGTSRNIPVEPDAGRYYVDVRPGRTYGFELAARAGGRWRTVCRTERVTVPALRTSPPEPGPLERLKPASARHVPGLRYETTEPYLATSPGAHREASPEDD